MADLLPCPFCGSPYVMYVEPRVTCDACNAEGPTADTEDGAVAGWNRRAGHPPPIGYLDAAAARRLPAQALALTLQLTPARVFDDDVAVYLETLPADTSGNG